MEESLVHRARVRRMRRRGGASRVSRRVGQRRPLTSVGVHPLSEFLDTHLPVLVISRGSAAGTEVVVGQSELTLGRGPGVDVAFDDSMLARTHAVIEFANGGFSIRKPPDGGELRVNGKTVGSRVPLHDGDQVVLGAQHLVFELRESRHIAIQGAS